MSNLTLGTFVFSGFEIPEALPLGGQQHLAAHKLPGGVRSIDALGPDEADITWSGQFRGFTASQRAKYLDTLRAQGQPLTLTFMDYRRTVIITGFTYRLEREGLEIPYSITLMVVSNDDNPITVIAPSIDDLVASDIAAMDALVQAIGDEAYLAAVEIQTTAAVYQAIYGVINQITIAYLEAKAAYQNFKALKNGNLAALGNLATGLTSVASTAATSFGLQQTFQASIINTSTAINRGIKVVSAMASASSIAGVTGSPASAVIGLGASAASFGFLSQILRLGAYTSRAAINNGNNMGQGPVWNGRIVQQVSAA